MCINKFSNNLVCKTNKENEEHVINSRYTSLHMPYTIYMHANIKKMNLTYLCRTLFSCGLNMVYKKQNQENILRNWK